MRNSYCVCDHRNLDSVNQAYISDVVKGKKSLNGGGGGGIGVCKSADPPKFEANPRSNNGLV
jgi:hypothetical protein